MKKVNTYLTSVAIVLISVLSISVGATTFRNIKIRNAAPVIIKRECAPNLVGMKKYNGEWISVIELPAVTVTETKISKSK